MSIVISAPLAGRARELVEGRRSRPASRATDATGAPRPLRWMRSISVPFQRQGNPLAGDGPGEKIARELLPFQPGIRAKNARVGLGGGYRQPVVVVGPNANAQFSVTHDRRAHMPVVRLLARYVFNHRAFGGEPKQGRPGGLDV